MLRPDALMLPRNAAVLDRIMADLLPGGWGVRVDTAQPVYVHLAGRDDTGETMVHLINYAWPDAAATCEIRLPLAKTPREVVSISVDDEGTAYAERPVAFSMNGNELRATVGDVRIHCSVIVRPQS
jgi:hypothetical protein